MELLFEKTRPGRRCMTFPSLEVPVYSLDQKYCRKNLELPELAEVDVVRHYTALSRRAYGVDDGFYPLGSCTMKYNPKVNEDVAALKGFTSIHPLQPEHTVQGALKAMKFLSDALMEITGMDAITLQPAAGAHGEYTGLSLIRAYHLFRGDVKRTKVIVPDSAHGTNPATANMAGFQTVNIPSNEENGVDLDALRAAVGEDTAALMLTNPTTFGLFEKNILEIAEIVHEAGGLLYYDGANLNAVMGIVRPGDTGFDVVHLNLHKTFSTPHGGGGPGSGPVGCKAKLAPFLPIPVVEETADGKFCFRQPEHTIGKVKAFYGNFGVYLRALTYILILGREGVRETSENAVLNANYLMKSLEDLYEMACPGGFCMHEFVMSLEKLKKETGVSAMDVAKSMIDHGVHPPTMYFPLTVPEALMFEPTETESKETLDAVVLLMRELYERAYAEPEKLHAAPVLAQIGRPDEVKAARIPVVRFPLKNE